MYVYVCIIGIKRMKRRNDAEILQVRKEKIGMQLQIKSNEYIFLMLREFFEESHEL